MVHSTTNPYLVWEVVEVPEVVGDPENFMVSSVEVGVIASSMISSTVICEMSKVCPVDMVEQHTIPRGSTSGR